MTERFNQYLTQLVSVGMQLPIIYDIGAHTGQWSLETDKVLKKITKNPSHFILFEANPKLAPALEQLSREQKYSYIVQILSKPGKTEVEFFDQDYPSTGATYYKETSAWMDNVKSTTLPCRTLDSIIEQYKLPIPNLVKMDTQGSELDILAGANRILGKTEMFYVECPMIQYNRGSPKMDDYFSFFINAGYIPVDIMEIHNPESILINIDILFVKKETKERYFGRATHTRVVPFN